MNHPSHPRYFPEQPDAIDHGFRWKELHSDYVYEKQYNAAGCDWWLRLTVPAGFIYNGASVPRLVWSIYPPHALDRAAVFHDFIYRCGGKTPEGSYQYSYDKETWHDFLPDTAWTRSQADSLFFKQLSEDPQGPGWLRRQAAYRAVQLFGGSVWGTPLYKD